MKLTVLSKVIRKTRLREKESSISGNSIPDGFRKAGFNQWCGYVFSLQVSLPD